MLFSKVYSAKLKNPNYLSELYACKFDKCLLSIDIGCLRTDSQILIQITIAHNSNDFLFNDTMHKFISSVIDNLQKKNPDFWDEVEKCIWYYNVVKLEQFPLEIMQRLVLL